MNTSQSSRTRRISKKRVNESDTDFENEIIVKQSLIKGNVFWLFENKGLYKLSATGEAWGGTSFDARNNLIPGENTNLNIGGELLSVRLLCRGQKKEIDRAEAGYLTELQRGRKASQLRPKHFKSEKQRLVIDDINFLSKSQDAVTEEHAAIKLGGEGSSSTQRNLQSTSSTAHLSLPDATVRGDLSPTLSDYAVESPNTSDYQQVTII